MTIAHSDAWTTPENMIKLVEAMDPTVTTSSEREGILKKLFGKQAELVLDGELKFEENGRAIARKLGFGPGDLGLVINGRVRE